MKSYQGYVFDLDGTVYLGDHLIPGAKDAIEAFKSRGAHVRYITNNPTKTTAEYAAKLSALGIPTSKEEVFNTVKSSVGWLVNKAPGSKVYPIGEEVLSDALTEAGVEVTEDPDDIDVVLVSYDRTLTYRKLKIAFDALWRSPAARLMATNPDRYCPLPEGKGEPDAGAIVAALEVATGRRCERHFGKPNTSLLDEAVRFLDIPARDVVFVGDRLETDIRMAIAAGIDSALVLTGDASRQDLRGLPLEAQPTHVLENLTELVPA